LVFCRIITIFVPDMKKYNFIAGFFCLALAISFCVSCDDAEEGIRYHKTVFPVGEAVWRSDVSAADQAVITNLINKMVKVESCQFYMGAQAKSVARANYFVSYTNRDTVWTRSGAAFWRDLKSKDTIWYNFDDFHFIDTIKAKYDTVSYATIYKSNGWVGPVIEVSMPDYYIGKFEVTQREWEAVMHKAPTGTFTILPDAVCDAPWYEEFGLGDDIPAYNVWFQDAVAFCDSLKAKTGLPFRLPTEAEWECAARGGRYCHGYRFIGTDDWLEAGWIYSNSAYNKVGNEDYGIHKGGEKRANELGLYDMAGNVSEWVANSYYHYGRTDSINPQGKTPLLNGQDTLILRGGSWMQKKYVDFSPANRKLCIMSSYSTEESLNSAFFNCGLRLCISPQ